MECAAYTVQGDSVTLYRLYGTGTVVEVPDRIDGKKVETLADHLFADEMSGPGSAKQLCRAYLEGSSWVKMDRTDPKQEMLFGREACEEELKDLEKEAYCGSRVSAIHIPEGVRRIENYACYGLYQLREVRFPSTIQMIGWGVFNGCRLVSRLVLQLEEGPESSRDDITPPILKELVDSLPHEIDVIVRRGSRELYRLRFPGYYEEGKENTPARIIEIIYHGTGRQYRNCFLGRELQFDRYDEVFPLAAAQESPVTNVHLILNRLRSGPAPKEEAERRYLEYLRAESGTLMEEILSDQDFDPAVTIRMLDRKEYYTSTIIDESIQTASEKGCSGAVSCLMEIRRHRFANSRRNRYVLQG